MISTGQHTLITQPDNNSEVYKHCILVKLTDSSAKAIEEFLKNKEIYFPTITYGQNEQHHHPQQQQQQAGQPLVQFKKFFFALSGVKESNKDSSASFACIAYQNSKLLTIGNVEQKLTIQANDEVFQATKEKVNNVAEEEKKNSLIEIKPSGAIVRNQVTSAANAMRSKQTTPSQSAKSSLAASSNIINSLATSISAEANRTRPVIDRPLRERVVHLLATKPYMKAVLFVKLNTENPLTDKDKDALDSILHTVATQNPKTLHYELNTDVWLNEVRDDWPFFNEQQTIDVKKRIAKARSLTLQLQQQQQSQTSTSIASNIPPNRMANNNNNSSNSKQQHNAFASAFVSIQQATSRSSSDLVEQHPESDSVVMSTMSKYPSKSAKIPAPQKISPPTPADALHQRRSATSSTLALNNLMMSASAAVVDPFGSPNSDDLFESSVNTSLNTSGAAKNGGEKENNEASKRIKDAYSSNDYGAELSKKYTKIVSDKQLEQYKTDFEAIYDDYVESHNYLKAVSKVFERHKQELDAIEDKHSAEFEKKKCKVFKDYAERQKDANYLKMRQQYAKLSFKLHFIKELVHQYRS